jgi:hypothetical protein
MGSLHIRRVLRRAGRRSQARAVTAVEVCDRVAARLEVHNTDGRLVLEAMAVAVGSIDADVAPLLRGNVKLNWPHRAHGSWLHF